jgi:diketogulonate reductase-like aldo/keto reductase
MRNEFIIRVLLLLVALFSSAPRIHGKTDEDDILWTTLSNGSKFPLVGFGVGNLQHELISDRIAKAISDETKTIMIDTAHASRNEGMVREGIAKGLKGSTAKEIHVVTKVWYTHLGYERTKLSVKASLEALKHPKIKVHILIHWPRCNDEIPWMNCLEEEHDLPDEVKKAGRPPHEYKKSAFLDSWAALEDIYLGKIKLGTGLPKVASIGVSNFALEDFKALEATQRMSPHILQVRIFSFPGFYCGLSVPSSDNKNDCFRDVFLIQGKRVVICI